MDKNVPLKQQIKMLTHRPGQRVFHWDHGGRGAARIQRIKHLRRRGTGQHLGATCKLQRRLMAEGSELALNGDFHRSTISKAHRFTNSQRAKSLTAKGQEPPSSNSRFLTTVPGLLASKLLTRLLMRGANALDNICDSSCLVAAGRSEQLHHGWIHSLTAGAGVDCAGIPTDYRQARRHLEPVPPVNQ